MSILDPYILHTVKRPAVVMQKGESVYLYDENNKKYLDGIGGWAVTSLGHCDLDLNDALINQAKQLWNASPYFLNRPMLNMSEFLCKKTGFDKVFFCSTGAEANESAIKLARKYGQKFKNSAYKIITFKQSFHGRTLACMSASGKEKWRALYEPKVPGFTHIEANNMDQLKRAIDSDTVAIMLEPIQGEGGVHEFDASFLKALDHLCKKENVLKIFDEVQTGIGRTGTFCAYEWTGVKPDILTLGKGIGGGFPLAAMMTHEKLDIFEAGDQGATYSAQPLGMAVGLEVCKKVGNQGFLQKVLETGEYFKKSLESLKFFGKIENIRGRGLMLAFEVPDKAPELMQLCLEKGLILNACDARTIRLIPPLIFEKKHVDEAVAILKEALSELS